MKFKLSDLWRWDGTVDRGTYVLVGVVLFILKHNLDRLVASLVFHQEWSPFNYLKPLDEFSWAYVQKNAAFYATMVAMALPFIWTGVVLTIRRLRAVKLPMELLALFFVPVINLLFFVILGLLPSRSGSEAEAEHPRGRFKTLLDAVIPQSLLGSAAVSTLIMVILALLGTVFAVQVMELYGLGLFVGLPFCVGLGSALLYSYHQRRGFLGCMAVSWVATGLLGLALVAFAVEGLICLLMALPLALVLASMGAAVGYVIQRGRWGKQDTLTLLLALVITLPAFMGAEDKLHGETKLIAIRTAIVVEAPPAVVWPKVVGFTELPPPNELLFKLGIAYPLKAEINGRGVGAIRHCVFSTGPFVEPIEVWDEPRRLKFAVTDQPPAMQEWSPYRHITPPHVEDYLVSEGGQFLLTPLPGGRTHLEGTTWYRHRIWPQAYWQLWSDALIHQIHTRVLRHVKALAEADMNGKTGDIVAQ